MQEEEIIKKINALAKKKKEKGLTTEELEEQKKVREQYLILIRKNLRGTLDTVDIVDKIKVAKKNYNIDKVMEYGKNHKNIKQVNELANELEILYDYKKINQKTIIIELEKFKEND